MRAARKVLSFRAAEKHLALRTRKVFKLNSYPGILGFCRHSSARPLFVTRYQFAPARPLSERGALCDGLIKTSTQNVIPAASPRLFRPAPAQNRTEAFGAQITRRRRHRVHA
jgi:hypothetical protein